MMIMEYNSASSQYASSTMSSETTLSGSCGSRASRIRTVRLVRPPHHGSALPPPPPLTCRHGPSLGFSIRGGREHGTGFFVSHVEPASEAHRQGLRIGDQIIRVNGFTVDDAVHKEVLQLVSNHTHLTLKVRSVGMIPVKDRKTDSLSWQIIADNGSLRCSPQLMGEKIRDVRINIAVAPRSKLGCGVCKGPEWRPGIFVQFTKEGGIAREAGLRPGDQILICNSVDFTDISFSEAVGLMKTARQLDLVVRKAAGSDLFPGESSGYNSSASSVTGDQSPSWADAKRLSIVKEETLDLEDRLSRRKWEKIGWDEADIDAEERLTYFKPTIINLSESGTTIKNNGAETDCGAKRIEVPEPKTVVVEVHRSDVDDIKTDTALKKSPSTGSFASLASSTASSSLSSAICQEIQRRSEKKKSESVKPSIDEQIQMKKILKGVTSEKQQQHNKLMDEFKKAHKKMFKASNDKAEEDQIDGGCKVKTTNSRDDLERMANNELSQKLSERLSTLSKDATTDDRRTCGVPAPPPPPPLPSDEGASSTLKPSKKGRAPPVPAKTAPTASPQPPPCPTPDYDSLSIASTATLSKHGDRSGQSTSQHNPHLANDTVEMESLDSYRINNPLDIKPKPPDTYFNNKSRLSPRLSNGAAANCPTSGPRKPQPQRPISVTIGEYQSATMRKQPGKLDFLAGGASESGRKGPKAPITSQLASELAQTLNRSNLRKRTESMENVLGAPQIKPQSNGSVRISLNNNILKNLTKSTNDLATLSENFNRVTINVNTTTMTEKRADAPNGILKNGHHKPLIQQKSITFGEMPTVINDRPQQVT